MSLSPRQPVKFYYPNCFFASTSKIHSPAHPIPQHPEECIWNLNSLPMPCLKFIFFCLGRWILFYLDEQLCMSGVINHAPLTAFLKVPIMWFLI